MAEARQRRRRRWPLFMLVLIGVVVVLGLQASPLPEAYKPISAAGQAAGSFTRWVMYQVNRQEACREAAMAQLALDRNVAQRKYNLEMQQWEAIMQRLSQRIAKEKEDVATYSGQCNLIMLMGQDGKELYDACQGMVALRYAPSLQMVEQEILRVQSQRPEAPALLSPNYTQHLDACNDA